MIELFDSHAHLQFFQKNIENILQQAINVGVKKIITVGTNPNDWDTCFNLSCLKYNNIKIYYTIGLHPCYINTLWEQNIDHLISFFKKKDYSPIALGEIGLDYHHINTQKYRNLQIQCFKKQLNIAKYFNKPVIIHSRAAFNDCMNIIDEVRFPWKKVIFHCFSENDHNIQIINNKGGIASFAGNITYKSNKFLLNSILKQGLEKLIIETDSPYLPPTGYRGHINEPSYIIEILKKCSIIFDKNIEYISKKIFDNTCAFFNLNY